MFDGLDSTDELFAYLLGTTMRMESDSLEMAGTLRDTARDRALKEWFGRRAESTRRQLANLHSILAITQVDQGADHDAEPLPTRDQSLHDGVVVSAALGTEHYAVSTYETLLTAAAALGSRDVVELLAENLDEQRKANEQLHALARDIADALADAA